MFFCTDVFFKHELRKIVLNKTLKGTRGVRPDNRKVLRAPSPRTKYFDRLFLYRSIKCYKNKIVIDKNL